jgi:hypothetical protein
VNVTKLYSDLRSANAVEFMSGSEMYEPVLFHKSGLDAPAAKKSETISSTVLLGKWELGGGRLICRVLDRRALSSGRRSDARAEILGPVILGFRTIAVRLMAAALGVRTPKSPPVA